jgi:hypothetical protein
MNLKDTIIEKYRVIALKILIVHHVIKVLNINLNYMNMRKLINTCYKLINLLLMVIIILAIILILIILIIILFI